MHPRAESTFGELGSWSANEDIFDAVLLGSTFGAALHFRLSTARRHHFSTIKTKQPDCWDYIFPFYYCNLHSRLDRGIPRYDKGRIGLTTTFSSYTLKVIPLLTNYVVSLLCRVNGL